MTGVGACDCAGVLKWELGSREDGSRIGVWLHGRV